MVNVRPIPARQERVENLDAFVETVHVAAGAPPIITRWLTDDASRCARIRDALNVAGCFRHDLKLARLIVAVARADYGDFADAAIVGDSPG